MIEEPSKGAPTRMAMLFALHAVFGGLILYLMHYYLPRYEKIFQDFGTKLPDITLLVLSLRRLFANYGFILVPCLGLIDGVVLVALNREGKVAAATAWGVIVWLAEMALIGLIVVAVLVPMNDLVMRLSR